MINPEAADNIPKKAPLALTDLKNKTTIIKIEVAEIDPSATTPNAFKNLTNPKIDISLHTKSLPSPKSQVSYLSESLKIMPQR